MQGRRRSSALLWIASSAQYAALLKHLGGVTTYPSNLYSYLGVRINYLSWCEKP
jgi:hypothetical protein